MLDRACGNCRVDHATSPLPSTPAPPPVKCMRTHFWCVSRTGPCHASPPPAHSLCIKLVHLLHGPTPRILCTGNSMPFQTPTNQRTYLMHLKEGPIPCYHNTQQPTPCSPVYLLARSIGGNPGAANVTPLLSTKTQAPFPNRPHIGASI